MPYWLKCRKNKESKTPKAVKTENIRIILLSKCPVPDSKKARTKKKLVDL